MRGGQILRVDHHRDVEFVTSNIHGVGAVLQSVTTNSRYTKCDVFKWGDRQNFSLLGRPRGNNIIHEKNENKKQKMKEPFISSTGNTL